MRLTARLAVIVAVASLVVAACSPATAPSPTPPLAAKKVKIVSSFPLQGPARSQTVQLVNAIKMALEEQGGKAGQTTVEYESYDDASPAKQGWDPAVEAENARRAAADPSVVAYIGTFNSGAAQVSIPITCQANLVMISPANTNPGLTKSFEADEPGKYYPGCKRNYARVVAADDIQGTVAARWAKELGARRVYILHDLGLYGKVLSDAFRAEVKRIGLEEVGYDGARRAAEFRALASRIAASGADLVYYGGIVSSNPGFLLRDLRQANPSIMFIGPDGIIDPRLLEQAGRDAIGAYLTFGVIARPNYTGKPKQWADRYTAKYGDSPQAYAIYAYEAAKVVLAAIASAGAMADDRVTVRDLVMNTKDFDGVLGKWSFDENGDTSHLSMGGLKVTKLGGDFGSSIEFQRELK